MHNHSMPSLKTLFSKTQSKAKSDKAKRPWARRMALIENMNMYYLYAISCVNKINKADEEILDEIMHRKEHSGVADLDYQSSAIAFYGFIRVVLETARLLKEDCIFSTGDDTNAEALVKLGKEYKSWAREVTNARNDIVAHPHRARKFILGPASWGSSGHITFRAANLEELSFEDVHDLTPSSDLGKLEEYIKKLTKLLDEAWFG